MRPVRRGASPQAVDFQDYAKARPELISRLGLYCSYCERPIGNLPALEHVQPKGGPHAHPDLEGRWENFLLACGNCNSTKGAKEVVLARVLLPDRDNTFAAHTYLEDGAVVVAPGLSAAATAAASATLDLVGLNKKIREQANPNEAAVATDRAARRMHAWTTALESKVNVDSTPGNQVVRDMTVSLATATGFFSIWMRVFAEDADMRRRLIEAFPGTQGSGCFDAQTGETVTPAPNPDGLSDGGKA